MNFLNINNVDYLKIKKIFLKLLYTLYTTSKNNK